MMDRYLPAFKPVLFPRCRSHCKATAKPPVPGGCREGTRQEGARAGGPRAAELAQLLSHWEPTRRKSTGVAGEGRRVRSPQQYLLNKKCGIKELCPKAVLTLQPFFAELSHNQAVLV